MIVYECRNVTMGHTSCFLRVHENETNCLCFDGSRGDSCSMTLERDWQVLPGASVENKGVVHIKDIPGGQSWNCWRLENDSLHDFAMRVRGF